MTRKRTEYDPHAVNQMRDRGNPRADVRWWLAHRVSVDAGEPILAEPRHARQGYIGRRELKVIFLEDGVRVYVITAMWIYSRGEHARQKRGK